MSPDHLADDLDRDTGSGGIGRCMPSQIMRPQLDSGYSSCFLHDDSGGRVCDREDSILRLNRSFFDVRPQTIYHLSGDENDLSVLAALWALDGQLQVGDIFGRELQDFTDPHSASGHQFQNEPVSHLRRSEDNLIHRLLFDNVPVDGFARSIDLPQHRSVAGVLNAEIQVGLDEVEKGFEVRVAAVLCLLLPAFGDLVEEGEDLFGCDGRQVAATAKMLTELAEGGSIGFDRIFFQNSFCGTLCTLLLRGRAS